MTVAVTTIAERALRRLGVAIVPVADRPMLNTMVPPYVIATNALVELGLLATGQVPPSSTDVMPLDTIATDALIELGVITTAQVPLPSADIVPLATIATDALIELGVIATNQVPPSQAGLATVAQIATNALTKLGVIAADETPSTSDQALAVMVVIDVHNSLVAQAIADWTQDGITFEVAEEYVALAAMHLASSFGKASDPALVPVLEGRIRTVSQVRRAQTQALHKAQEVHESLVAQAIADWTSDTVPAAVAEEYTRLTATHLASSFGKNADPQMVPVLEARIRIVSQVRRAQAQALQKAQEVHESLVAGALASWTQDTVPVAVAEEYTRLTAAALASSFGKDADPQMVPILEKRIGSVARLMQAQAEAQAKVAQVQASLTSQALVSWDDGGVPTAVAEEYTQLTAIALAPGFGKQADPQMVPGLEARVRRMAIVLASPGEANTAVMAVHNNLVARGLVRWTVFDLPAAAELPYEVLAANRLAPLYDKQFDANEELLAMRALAQIIALETSGERTVAEYF